jgi:hypothetical protein
MLLATLAGTGYSTKAEYQFKVEILLKFAAR